MDSDEDVKSMSKVIKRGMDWAMGPEIECFEKALAKYIGSTYCIAFNSGTSALHASLLATGVSKGSEVLVPSFTFIATANSVLMVNARPKFVDAEEETYGMNPSYIQSSISKKTSAIMPIHYAGLPCKIEEIAQIAKRKKIWLIEDAAESLGASVNKRKVGTFGDIGMFSFAGNKILTTGEGGCLVTDSKKLYEKLKLIRSHGRLEHKNYFHSIDKPEYVTLGYNWRMSSITAALALSQLERIGKLIEMRRRNAEYLSRHIKKQKRIITPNEPKGHKHVYQLYSIRMENKIIRNALMKFLSKRGIMSKVFFHPVHMTKFYSDMGFSNNMLKTTETISNQILSLPMYPGLKREELDFICNTINEFMDEIKI